MIIISADKPLGLATLGGAMFTRGKNLEHWEEVLKYQKTHTQRWHKLQDLQVAMDDAPDKQSDTIPACGRKSNRSASVAVPQRNRR